MRFIIAMTIMFPVPMIIGAMITAIAIMIDVKKGKEKEK